MAIVYPAGLRPPLRENYSFEPVNNIVRTSMDSGRARQRVEFENTPDLATISFIHDQTQALLFKSWVRQVAKSNWVFIPLLSEAGYDTLEVRFIEVPDGGKLLGKFLWRYDCRIEVRKPPMLEPGWADILPDYVLMADIFDRAVNEQWPDSPYQIHMDVFDYAANEQWPNA